MNKGKSVFLSAILGNILEYYDFTVYVVFSIIIGKTFFPGDSEIIQILSSLAVFAAGFITRPIGGIIFGFIGDRFGRRVSLITSMLGMTIPTFIIGLIPGYAEIGYLAPILLVLMRLAQGLCISGEGAGAAIFILEHIGDLRPGFTAGLVHGSGITGTLVASLIGIALNQLLPGVEFAWRFAFLLGGFMGLAGFYFRLQVAETPIFIALAEKKKTLKAPFIHVLKKSWRVMFITAAMGGFASSIVYLIKSYVKVFYCDVLGFDDTSSSLFLSYSSVILMISMPLSGYISDRIGRFKTVTISSIAVLLLCCPTLYLMSCESLWQQLLALALLAILAGSVAGSAYVFVISLFSPEERFSGVGFSYNLGVAIFGGTSALISRWLIAQTGLYYAPAFYIIATSGAFLTVIYFMRNVIQSSLDVNLKAK
jgi:MHS family proline/betaine transporter-like MFS transporter